MQASDHHFGTAVALRNRIIAKQTNETPIQAWAAVCRECANANNAKRRELAGKPFHSFSDNRFFTRLDRIWDVAKAQVEALS